jgi:hypothetical protein
VKLRCHHKSNIGTLPGRARAPARDSRAAPGGRLRPWRAKSVTKTQPTPDSTRPSSIRSFGRPCRTSSRSIGTRALVGGGRGDAERVGRPDRRCRRQSDDAEPCHKESQAIPLLGLCVASHLVIARKPRRGCAFRRLISRGRPLNRLGAFSGCRRCVRWSANARKY